MQDMIQIEHLHKSFGEVHAVNDLSFRVKQGELFAFLGINGAGKSTTISIICGTLKQDSGSVFVGGKDVKTQLGEITNRLGVVFQNSVLDAQLSVRDNLMMRASLYSISSSVAKTRIDELAALLDFQPLLKRTVGKLSGGQRRRIDVARALINDPALLILDEPTTGIDPKTRKIMWSVIEKYRKQKGMTVLLTTHYMEEAAEAEYIVIIDDGSIVAEGTPHDLKTRYTGDFITLYGVSEEDVLSLSLPYERVKSGWRVAVQDTLTARDLVIRHPDLFTDFEISKGKMDDVFLAVTGKKLEDTV